MSNIEEKITNFLDDLAETLDINREDLKLESKFEDINWDSLSIISSIALIDEHFNKSISASQISECSSIEELIRIIE